MRGAGWLAVLACVGVASVAQAKTWTRVESAPRPGLLRSGNGAAIGLADGRALVVPRLIGASNEAWLYDPKSPGWLPVASAPR